ncbi:structural protein MipA [Pseudomonas aeruginosa]|uniref:MipA/OmpV family protein n=1 Tax=Pseudomonas aeruginosa TaxID=287 RepID=UPI000F543D0D|nr:MipA/OmpV family protein [Pseudomonas aeruginosa]RPW63922.1 structural protein MipA [Pseudomonas aeruginosa]HCT8839271.1 MipA/OmpV family protein [Pseudomonas aeruginosa]
MNYNDKRLTAVCGGILLLGIAGTATAQTEHDSEPRSQRDSENSLGLGVGIAPEYLGARDSRVQLVPMVVVMQGPFYLDSTRGVGYRHETRSGLFFGQSLNWDPGRTDHDSKSRPGSDRLRGMGTVKGSLITSLEVGYYFAPWLAVRAESEFALTERDRGNRFSLGLEGGLWSEGKNDIWYSTNAYFSDGRFAQSYFGVTSDQSAASGFSRYTPDRGFYAYSASINWEHRFDKHWSAMISVNAVSLADDARKSPIVQESLNTFALGAINYIF